MSDQTPNADLRDFDWVSIDEDRDLQNWAARFAVTPARLKEAVRKVGPFVRDVRRELSTDSSPC